MNCMEERECLDQLRIQTRSQRRACSLSRLLALRECAPSLADISPPYSGSRASGQLPLASELRWCTATPPLTHTHAIATRHRHTHTHTPTHAHTHAHTPAAANCHCTAHTHRSKPPNASILYSTPNSSRAWPAAPPLGSPTKDQSIPHTRRRTRVGGREESAASGQIRAEGTLELESPEPPRGMTTLL